MVLTFIRYSESRPAALYLFSLRRLSWGVGIRHIALGILIAAGMFAGTRALAATTYTVTTLADSSGSCSGSSCTTLRAAMVAANSSAGNNITFVGLSGTITLTGSLPTVTQNMTITGPGANTLTISGNNAFQILNISSGTMNISGLSFANGNNHGGDAGAIFASGGALTVTNSTFSGNNGNYGGAITSYGAMTVVNCTFSGNTAENGGGAINSNVTLSVINSTFSGNTTSGGSYNPNNGVYGGGAILNFGNSMTVVNNTFSGNSTGAWGGAIYSQGGSPGTLAVENNIFAANSASNAAGIAAYSTTNASYNLFYQNLDAGGAEDDCANCTNNTNAITGSNPNLLPLGFYGGPTETLLPQPGSPAICTGNSADVPNGVTTDQRGFSLTSSTCNNGGVDLGSVQAGSLRVNTTADSNDGSCESVCSLRDAITAANAIGDGADIAFAPGITGTVTLTSALPAITQNMAIMGPGAANLTISGNNAYQILKISSGTVTVFGITFANGLATSSGGGAIDNGGSLSVVNCTFSNNAAPQGAEGGAISNYGPLVVSNSTFANNVSQLYGGAIFGAYYGSINVNNSTFSGNSANQGGAIYSDNPLTLTSSTISGNSAVSGGGVFNGSGSSLIANSIVTQDSGGECVGVGCSSQGVYFQVSGTAQQINGSWDGTITLSWTDSLGNYYSQAVSYGEFSTPASIASGFGGGISNAYLPNASAEAFGSLIVLTLYNGATFGPFTISNSSQSFTMAQVTENIFASNNIVGTAANLAPLGNYGGPTQTMIPLPGSSAICGGLVSGLASGVNTDQRGFSRTTNYDGNTCVDVGAVQTDYTAAAFSSSSYNGIQGLPVSPAPVVTVAENGQNIGSVPVTLAYSGTGSLTGLGPVTTVSGVGAAFDNLEAPAPTEGTLSVSLPITASGSAAQPTPLAASASLDIIPNTQAIAFSPPTMVTYGTAPITLTATGGGSGNPVTFSLDPASTAGAALLNGSTLTINGAGTIVINANQAAGKGYLAAPQVQQSVVVTPASVSITASSPTVTYGSTVPTITPIFGSFFNGNTSAVLTTQPACTTTYTTTSPAGSSPSTSCSGAAAANYTFTYANGTVTVNQATPLIAWAAPAAITYGTALSSAQLDATTSIAGTFTYTPAAGALLTAGSHALNANFTPTDSADYTGSTASVTLVVNQATPQINWSTPAAIAYGTPLSASQLDATASVPGTFAYNPPAGTIPAIGSDALSVIFTPTDATDYTSATAAVNLLVVEPLPTVSSLSPAVESAGGAAFTLTVNGAGLTAASVVYWGSAALTTQYVNGTRVTAQIPAADIATAGTYAISVQNPSPGGGTSNVLQLEVDSAGGGNPPDFTTVTATVAPGSTASYGVTLPSTASDVSVTCLNLPSGAACTYSATTGAVSITTTSATPAGTYQIIVVFTETLPGAATALILLPTLLLPVGSRRKWSSREWVILSLLGIALTAIAIGCGGSSSHQVTSAGVVTLIVQ